MVIYHDKIRKNNHFKQTKENTWNAKCPVFWATLPLKPASIAYKIGHLALQIGGRIMA